MNSNKKPSGAAFKKMRMEKEAESIRNTRSITTFFNKNNGLFTDANKILNG